MDEELYKQLKKVLTEPGYGKGIQFPEVPEGPDSSRTIMGKPTRPIPLPQVRGGLIPEFINGKPTGRMIEAPEGYWENIDPGFSAGWAGGDSTGVDTTTSSVQSIFGIKQLLALISLLNPNKK